MFIKLTNIIGIVNRISVNNINSYEPLQKGTLVRLKSEHILYVIETPEIIDQMLAELYITVKSPPKSSPTKETV